MYLINIEIIKFYTKIFYKINKKKKIYSIKFDVILLNLE